MTTHTPRKRPERYPPRQHRTVQIPSYRDYVLGSVSEANPGIAVRDDSEAAHIAPVIEEGTPVNAWVNGTLRKGFEDDAMGMPYFAHSDGAFYAPLITIPDFEDDE